MLIFFCILSPEIREAWSSAFCRFVPGHSKKLAISERQGLEENLYMTDRTAPGSKLKEEDTIKDVEFTFTGNTYENPLAIEADEDSKPTATEKTEGAEGTDNGDADSLAKVDLTAVVDDPDDQKQSNL